MSSCRMSGTSSEGVVDTAGAVWGYPGLFVADGSVMPTSTGINPMITIEALAYSISKHVATYVQRSQGVGVSGDRARL
jgi:long-chain-alcohol oxidase